MLCIEHGQLLDRPTVDLLAQRGIWLSGQYLVPNTPSMPAERKAKRQGILEGNARVWPMAKEAGVKLAWGTDFLFEPDLNPQQNKMLLSLTEWFSSAELLRLATYDNAQLLALSGPRVPYAGTLGVVEPRALADLIVVNGDPLADINLIADPGKNFDVVMKDGKLYKNTSRRAERRRRSVPGGEPFPDVVALLDLVDKGKGVIGTRNLRTAIVFGDQDVTAGAVGAGGLARRERTEQRSRRHIEPVEFGGRVAQGIEDLGVGECLGLPVVVELGCIHQTRPALGDKRTARTADDAESRAVRDSGVDDGRNQVDEWTSVHVGAVHGDDQVVGVGGRGGDGVGVGEAPGPVGHTVDRVLRRAVPAVGDDAMPTSCGLGGDVAARVSGSTKDHNVAHGGVNAEVSA